MRDFAVRLWSVSPSTPRPMPTWSHTTISRSSIHNDLIHISQSFKYILMCLDVWGTIQHKASATGKLLWLTQVRDLSSQETSLLIHSETSEPSQVKSPVTACHHPWLISASPTRCMHSKQSPSTKRPVQSQKAAPLRFSSEL